MNIINIEKKETIINEVLVILNNKMISIAWLFTYSASKPYTIKENNW